MSYNRHLEIVMTAEQVSAIKGLVATLGAEQSAIIRAALTLGLPLVTADAAEAAKLARGPRYQPLGVK